MTSIGQLLARAAPGEVVEVPVGRYADETFPLTDENLAVVDADLDGDIGSP